MIVNEEPRRKGESYKNTDAEREAIMLLKTLVFAMMLIMMYAILFLPAFLMWFLVNIAIFRNAIAKAKHKKTIWFATLFAFIGIELGCLFYINAHPFVVYDKTTISDETAEKVLTYVHSRPERFVVENFGGFKLSNLSFKFKEEIFIVGGNVEMITYDIASIPLGWNHWSFKLDENNEISPW